MEIAGNNLSSLNSGNPVSNVNKKIAGNKTAAENPKQNPELKQKLKEAATEMFKDTRIMGEWKDKEGLDQTTDPTMGGDIRYALTSKNIDFLKRLRLGNLTLGELREVTHRIRELERTMTKNSNILSGKIIETEA
jgi:hypothetical protein